MKRARNFIVLLGAFPPTSSETGTAMPSTYDSHFWLLRTQEAQTLAEQMNDLGARQGMLQLAKKYERIGRQRACAESRITFEKAREALRVSQDAASREQLDSLTKAIDKAWEEMRKTAGELEVFHSIHILRADEPETIESHVVSSSAR
jgi:hypothetical protein